MPHLTDSSDPSDYGITLSDWSNADPESFDKAIESAFDTDWRAMLADLAFENDQTTATKARVREKLGEALVGEVMNKREWVADLVETKFGR